MVLIQSINQYFRYILFISVCFFAFLMQPICPAGLGGCPKITFMDAFNVQRFTGHWYEIERSFYLMQVISSCVTVDLTRTAKGHLEVDVISKSRWSGRFTVSEGLAQQGKKHPSLLVYKVNSKLPRLLSRYLPGTGIYQVISSDYDTYAIIYSCTNYGILHTDLIWIWARDKELTVSQRAKVYQILHEKNLDSERLYLPKNHNCTEQ